MATISTVNAVRMANNLTNPVFFPFAGNVMEPMFGLDLPHLGTEGGALWICEIPGMKKKHMGIWALTNLKDLINGHILPHEAIIDERVDTLLKRRLVEDKEISPIVLSYKDSQEIRELIEYGRFGELPDEGFEWHWGIRTWKVSDIETIEKFQNAFSGIKQVLVADGHHRLAAALQVGSDEKWISSIYVPDEELEIASYHRLLPLAGEEEVVAVLEKLEIYFRISAIEDNVPYRPESKNCFGMFLKDTWYKMELRDNFKEESCPDVRFLQDKVLTGIFDLKDLSEGCRLEMFADCYWEQYLCRLSDIGAAAGFTIYPMDSGELFHAAEKGNTLPPKSTWIGPKIPIGALVHSKTAKEQGGMGR